MTYVGAEGGAFLESSASPVVESFAQGLVGVLGQAAVSIVLYGSSARGQNRPDSDFDLLLIAEGDTRQAEERACEFRAEFLFRERRGFSVLVYSREDFAFAVKQAFPFMLGVASGYRILYDPTGFFKEQMEVVERMEAEGLVKRYSRGWVWVTGNGL